MSLNKIKNNLNNKSKIVCKYFIVGKCTKGKNCPYLHSIIDMSNIECPMYSIGYCKNGPLCQFSHIKKEKLSAEEDGIWVEEEEEKASKNKEENMIEEDVTSSTPLAEDFINDTYNKNEKIKNNNKNIACNYNKQTDIKERIIQINNNSIKDKSNNQKKNFPLIPIWYLEHYYDKPISLIFSELENQNLPEVISLQKKYGLENEFDKNVLNEKLLIKEDYSYNNTFNLNFNNFNMNFDLSNNIPNLPPKNKTDPDFNDYTSTYISKDQIEYIINKDRNIYYYLIKLKKYKTLKKAYESNIIKLPEILYDKYKNKNLLFNDITVIIIIYNYEYDEFEGFAKLLYPIINEFNENKKLYKIEWLWKNKMDYSEVGHLLNKADHDHFLNEGKNGCPIHKDLGNYICRLMIKRLSREELIELINEKNIFKNQILYNQYLQNLKRYQYDYNDYYYNYYDHYNYFYYEYDDDNSYNENISHKGKDKAKLKDSNDKYFYHNRESYSRYNYNEKSRSRSRNSHRYSYRSKERSPRKSNYYSDQNNKNHRKRRKSSDSLANKFNKKHYKKKMHSHRNIESESDYYK